MLEQKDLQAIAEIIDVRVTKTEQTLGSKIDALEERVSGLEARVTEVETNLINELVRPEDILTRRMDKVKKNLEEINQYYRINKMENDNTGLILKMMEEFQKRLEALEKRNAWRVIKGWH